ncbi:Smr protein/MutS2 [mine drainage metagenome]|uniref:Smr protein/MutS2 n=2 Tax=mine drainage metagenome TaxID=410659 RepID=T0ZX46_9ZZZZ
MAEVRRLRPAPEKPIGPKPKPKAYQRQRGHQAVLDATLQGGPGIPDLGDADSVSFRQTGVQKRVLEQLKRGQITIKAVLDLHGLTLDEALAQLGEFIDAKRHAEITSVLIVHGKGLRSGSQGPILRPAIQKWLTLRQDVLAFATARQCDGGSGATYVLLKRL